MSCNIDCLTVGCPSKFPTESEPMMAVSFMSNLIAIVNAVRANITFMSWTPMNINTIGADTPCLASNWNSCISTRLNELDFASNLNVLDPGDAIPDPVSVNSYNAAVINANSKWCTNVCNCNTNCGCDDSSCCDDACCEDTCCNLGGDDGCGGII